MASASDRSPRSSWAATATAAAAEGTTEVAPEKAEPAPDMANDHHMLTGWHWQARSSNDLLSLCRLAGCHLPVTNCSPKSGFMCQRWRDGNQRASSWPQAAPARPARQSVRRQVRSGPARNRGRKRTRCDRDRSSSRSRRGAAPLAGPMSANDKAALVELVRAFSILSRSVAAG